MTLVENDNPVKIWSLRNGFNVGRPPHVLASLACESGQEAVAHADNSSEEKHFVSQNLTKQCAGITLKLQES